MYMKAVGHRQAQSLTELLIDSLWSGRSQVVHVHVQSGPKCVNIWAFYLSECILYVADKVSCAKMTYFMMNTDFMPQSADKG